MANIKDRIPNHSDDNGKPAPTSSRGTTFLRISAKLFILVFLSAYSAAAILVHCPADLSSVQGYGPASTPSVPEPDAVFQRLADAVATRLEPIVLREDEVNAYIAAHLQAVQSGYSGRYVSFKGVYVDFSTNRCRIFMEREVFGHRSTMAIDLKISREGDHYLTEFTGGQFGRLNVAQGFLLLVKHAYDRLATRVFADELDLIFQMNQIRFDENQMVLDPRFPKPAN